MVCIYCSGKTEVANSRLQRANNVVWRRRICVVCGAAFTTHEQADLAASFRVQHEDGSLSPFSRDKLFLSILQASGHRRAPIEDSGALTKTVISNLPVSKEGLVDSRDLIKKTMEILRRFDNAAATHYSAYHPLSIS